MMASYERYKKIRDKKGLKDNDVAKRTKISQSTFTAWKKGEYEPKVDKLIKIADALNVSLSAIVGNYGKFSRYNLNRQKPRELSEEEQFDAELCRLYHNATPDAQTTVMTVLKSSQKDASDSSKGA